MGTSKQRSSGLKFQYLGKHEYRYQFESLSQTIPNSNQKSQPKVTTKSHNQKSQTKVTTKSHNQKSQPKVTTNVKTKYNDLS